MGQVASWGSKNPLSSIDEVCSRDDRGLLGDNFDFCTLRETLRHIKMDVCRCLEWLDMGQGPSGFGSRPSLESLVRLRTPL